MKPKKIHILIVEPNQRPRREVIENEYDVIKNIIGGRLEVVQLDVNTDIVRNEEGKLIGLDGNRKVGRDIIVGTFIIVGNDGSEDFVSLSKNQMEIYEERFWEPEEYTNEDVAKTIHAGFIGF